MQPFRPRKRNAQTGEMLCEGCENGREGRPLTGKKTAVPEPMRVQAKMIRTAHGVMDGVTVMHCPLCFSGDTKYMTRDGVKTFEDTVGSTQWVLTADKNDRTGGRWVEAHIHEFGSQPLMRVTLSRNGVLKVIEATPEHRWLIKENLKVREDDGTVSISRKGKPRDWRPTHCKRGHDLANARVKKNGTRDCPQCAALAKAPGGISRSTNREVETQDLRPGHRVSTLRPSTAVDLEPDPSGIRHGIVFGDGTRTGPGSANVTLWGEKDKQLLSYFPDRRYSETITPNGVPGIRVSGDLFAWMKDTPDLDTDPAVLYGFLAGYFAADGTVDKIGVASIASANLSHLEFVRDAAARLGISTYGITSRMREGFPGRDPSAIYNLIFLRETLHESFFLIEEHRNRWIFGRDASFNRFGWVVKSVEMTDRVEPVFCAAVPETHSFALEDNIWVKNCGSGQVISNQDGTIACGFCDQNFTVLVQPKQPMAPQTVNGQPYPPGSKEQTPEDAAAKDDPDADRDTKSFGGEDLSEKTSDDDAPPADDDGGNPFAKKDKDDAPPPGIDKDSMLITDDGVAIPLDEYMAHLALAVTKDPRTTVQEVRSHRRES